jgi:hypothetical protein
MNTKLLLMLLSTLLASSAAASDMKPPLTCHRLMTEKECSDHKIQLATLSPGEALDHYLAEYVRTRKERETLCNCLRASASVETKPLQRQAQLRF